MQMGSARPPIGVLYDCDMGRQIDAVLALAMLYTLEVRGQARVVALTTSENNLHSAAVCDALARFYQGRPLPVGMSIAGKPSADTPILNAVLAKPGYTTTVKKLNDTAEVAPALRNALTAQHDGNATIVLAGKATDIVELLHLFGAKDWIEHKNRTLVVALGSYPNGPAADPEVKADLAAARQLFAEWPTPIVAVGTEVGQALPFPAESLDKDFSYAPDHPVVDAYKAFQPMPYAASTRALSAVWYAVKPDSGDFQLSAPGRITIKDDGQTAFTPAADGKHRFLIADSAKQEKLLKMYVELVSAKPKERSFGPRKA